MENIEKEVIREEVYNYHIQEYSELLIYYYYY